METRYGQTECDEVLSPTLKVGFHCTDTIVSVFLPQCQEHFTAMLTHHSSLQTNFTVGFVIFPHNFNTTALVHAWHESKQTGSNMTRKHFKGYQFFTTPLFIITKYSLLADDISQQGYNRLQILLVYGSTTRGAGLLIRKPCFNAL